MINIPRKAYIDSLSENSRNRRDMSTVFNDQDNEVDSNKLTNLDRFSVERDPSSDNELANKKYLDDSLGECSFPRFQQTMQNHPKVSVG